MYSTPQKDGKPPLKVVVEGLEGKTPEHARALGRYYQGVISRFYVAARQNSDNAVEGQWNQHLKLPGNQGHLIYSSNQGMETLIVRLNPENVPTVVDEPKPPKPETPWDWAIVEFVVREMVDDETAGPARLDVRATRVKPVPTDAEAAVIVTPIDTTDDTNDALSPPTMAFAATNTIVNTPAAGIALGSLRVDLRKVASKGMAFEAAIEGKLEGADSAGGGTISGWSYDGRFWTMEETDTLVGEELATGTGLESEWTFTQRVQDFWPYPWDAGDFWIPWTSPVTSHINTSFGAFDNGGGTGLDGRVHVDVSGLVTLTQDGNTSANDHYMEPPTVHAPTGLPVEAITHDAVRHDGETYDVGDVHHIPIYDRRKVFTFPEPTPEYDGDPEPVPAERAVECWYTAGWGAPPPVSTFLESGDRHYYQWVKAESPVAYWTTAQINAGAEPMIDNDAFLPIGTLKIDRYAHVVRVEPAA